jgi:hypothetical protein
MLVKLLFLFALVVVFRREWLDAQLARHGRTLARVLGLGLCGVESRGEPEARVDGAATSVVDLPPSRPWASDLPRVGGDIGNGISEGATG